MEWRRVVISAVAAIGFARATAMGAELVSIQPLKLIIVDKVASSSSPAKVVYVAKDDRITKGSGTDPGSISSNLTVYYDGYFSVHNWGLFYMPPGAGWLVNTATVAKYVNKNAPSGGATKVSVIKPGKLLRYTGKSLGDVPVDISSPSPPDLPVEYRIWNGVEETHLCGAFPRSACSHKSIAGGTGWKLECKNGVEIMCRDDPCWLTPCGAFVD